MYYDIKKIEKLMNSLNIPKKYRNIPIRELLGNNISMVISIRENAGKTSEGLLIGLCMNWIYNTTTIYLRSDDNQIRRKSVELLYGTIVKFGYLKKITKNRYNDFEYSAQKKTFYMIKRDDSGDIIDKNPNPICQILSNESWLDYKSTFNNPNANFIFYDECFDTNRATLNQWEEFMNNISTVGRPDSRRDDEGNPLCHVLMTGNNTNLYSPWFDDFCISSRVRELKFGDFFREKTELGTTLFVKLLAPDDSIREKIKSGRIDFFGFKTKKAAQFIGISEWSGKSYPHLDVDLSSWRVKKIFQRIFIRHRGFLIQAEIYQEKGKNPFIFFHFASGIYKNMQNIIFCLDPKEQGEYYGFGEYHDFSKEKGSGKVVHLFKMLMRENCCRFASNQIGELVDDFAKNI